MMRGLGNILHRLTVALVALMVAVAIAVIVAATSQARSAADPASATVYPVAHPVGLMVTSGGWAYCQQVQTLARRTGYTLLCGRYYADGYTSYGLRSQRQLDWGDPAYLASLAAKIQTTHQRVGGKLVLIGVSYSGFAVATLASHHPELRPDRLIVIDSYLDLVARRAALRSTHPTAREIDAAVSRTGATLQQLSVNLRGLARLVRAGTDLTVIWSVSPDEQKRFAGATCDLSANAATLANLANTINKPIAGWVTQYQHGHDLWDHGAAIMAGYPPGRQVTLRPNQAIPAGAVCP